jgi:transposase-like protein
MEALVIADHSEFKIVKPSCPECGSGYVISNGHSYYCKECGRQFSKHKRTNREAITDRAPCIECGSLEVISRGGEWECKTCGRRFKKVRRG